jgi:hypothetical protein
MANLNYAGETWKITGSLTDANGDDIYFSDLEEMTIKLFDERGESITYKLSDGDITEGITTTSFSLIVPASDSSEFSPGALKGEFTIVFPSTDFSGGTITDKIVATILEIHSVNGCNC